MTGPVVLSSTIRANLLQQSNEGTDANAAQQAQASGQADQQQVQRLKTIEDSFKTPALNARATELGQSLDTIVQGLKILTKTQDALNGLGALLRDASLAVQGDADPKDLAKAFVENAKNIDAFIRNNEYAGINLLDGDEISIVTDDNAEPIAIEGRNYDAESLGLTDIKADTKEALEGVKEAIRFALDSVQNYSVILKDYINTIQSRQDFTQNTIDVLNEAAEGALEVKNLDEEGVNLLALQTKLQLAAQGTSLASPDQSALLDLF